MESTRDNLTITFPFTLHAAPGVDVAGAVPETFNRDTYSDGRHDFSRELAADGLDRIAREAAREAARQHFEAIHGDAYEEHQMDGGGSSSHRLADRLADDWMRDNFGGAFVSPEGWRTTIERAD
jgi:hypothetical protein